MELQIGELFMLGFRGPQIPQWMNDFAHEFGLGGVILFDYDCTDKKYERNIFNPAQVKQLCEQIHALPSHPLIFIDQEGGKVRRLKEQYGFVPLPSARQFGRLTAPERIRALRPSYTQMREVGIDVNLSPVVDLDLIPDSPDVGSVQRSYSADPKVVEKCVNSLVEVGRSVSLKLCLKHFPGTGGAKVNPHDHVMDLSDCLTNTQVNVFKTLLARVPMVLFSHGMRRCLNCNPSFRATLSRARGAQNVVAPIVAPSNRAIAPIDDPGLFPGHRNAHLGMVGRLMARSGGGCWPLSALSRRCT